MKSFLQKSWDSGATGFNITQPWKKVLGGASINTLYRETEATNWSATSTDGAGFFAGATRIGCQRENIRRAIFFGSGGAVDAIAKNLDVPVHCLVRDPAKYRSQQGTPSNRYFHDWSRDAFERLLTASEKSGTLIVQATPAPFQGISLAEFVPPLTSLQGTAAAKVWFVDLCYGRDSDLLEGAKTVGIAAQDGLPMLIEQARSAQTIWWGKSAPYETIANALANFVTTKISSGD